MRFKFARALGQDTKPNKAHRERLRAGAENLRLQLAHDAPIREAFLQRADRWRAELGRRVFFIDDAAEAQLAEQAPFKRPVAGSSPVGGTNALKLKLLERQGWRCGLCGLLVLDETDANLDHIIPRSRGGHRTEKNLQATHRICNTMKGSGHGGIVHCVTCRMPLSDARASLNHWRYVHNREVVEWGG